MFNFFDRIFRHSAISEPNRPQAPQTHADDHDADENSEDLIVLRHAVLDRNKRVVGHEFLQQQISKTTPTGVDAERAFLKFLKSVIASTTPGERSVITTIPASVVFNPILEELAHAGVVVMVRFGTEVKDLAALTARLKDMHQMGLVMGLADARMALMHPELGNGSRMAFLPVDQINPPDLLQAVRSLRAQHPHMQLYASGVNSHEEFEVCRKLRMRGFTGPFVTHRRDWQSNKIDPDALRLCKLVNSLRSGSEMDVIVNDIKLDPLLSYRILCHANSAAIGAQQKVLAIKDAILLIGREPLFRWLVLLLCASAPSHAEDSALLEHALVRGRLMELLAADSSSPPAEDFFLTGVLSLLDAILQVPASTLFHALDLPEAVKNALLEHQGPCAGLLRLAEACEQITAESVCDLCAELGIESRRFNEAHHAALDWARGHMRDEADKSTPELAPPDEVTVAASLQTTEAPLAAEAAATGLDSMGDAAQRGEPEALLAMGEHYALGKGLPQDLAKSLEYYTRAAEHGHATAQWNVAAMLAQGQDGIPRDLPQAACWYRKAADQGFAPAQAALGLMYATAQGVEKDVNTAIGLLQKASLQGDIEAQYNLAIMYEQGLAGPRDLAQALALFVKAADQGLAAAQEKLGLMYATGQAVTQDLVEAYKWFSIASEEKQGTAHANLEHCLSLLDDAQIAQGLSRAKLWMSDHAASHTSE